MQLPWWCCFPANLPRMLSRPSLCARRAAETGVSQLARTHGIHHTQHAQHAASSYGNHCRRRCCRWRPEKSAEEEVPFLLLRDCGCWCACAGARAGILGFAHATAGKEKKIPLTREKQQQKTPKSTKTPPKNNKNTKNKTKKPFFFVLAREIKPLTSKKTISHPTKNEMKPKKRSGWCPHTLRCSGNSASLARDREFAYSHDPPRAST